MQIDEEPNYCRKSFKALCKKYRAFEKDYEHAKRLLSDQFCPLIDSMPLANSRLLHRESGVSDSCPCELWKLNISVTGAGLRPSQWPRFWFALIEADNIIVPLVLSLHQDDGGSDQDPKNEAMKKIAAYFRQEPS